MFVTESGGVHRCFLSEPIGNWYETPLAEIWNSPRALAKRSRMISGHYRSAAYSEPSCSWREGRLPQSASPDQTKHLLAEMKELGERAERLRPGTPPELPGLGAIRRLLCMRESKSLDWEALFRQLSETNSAAHELGQACVTQLESELRGASQERDLLRMERKAFVVRIAVKISRERSMNHILSMPGSWGSVGVWRSDRMRCGRSGGHWWASRAGAD